MPILSSSINWLAVALSSLALTALGGAWFVGLFKKPYALALGRTDLAEQKPSPLFIAGPFVCGAIVTITNAMLMRALGVASIVDGLVFGVIVGVGYLAATTVNVAINPNIPRPLLYGLVSGSFFVVGNLLSCLILAAWR